MSSPDLRPISVVSSNRLSQDVGRSQQIYGNCLATLNLQPQVVPHLLESPSSGLSLLLQVSKRLRSSLHLFDLNFQLQVSSHMLEDSSFDWLL